MHTVRSRAYTVRTQRVHSACPLHGHCMRNVCGVQCVHGSPSPVTTRRDGASRVLTERAISPPAAHTVWHCSGGESIRAFSSHGAAVSRRRAVCRAHESAQAGSLGSCRLGTRVRPKPATCTCTYMCMWLVIWPVLARQCRQKAHYVKPDVPPGQRCRSSPSRRSLKTIGASVQRVK